MYSKKENDRLNIEFDYPFSSNIDEPDTLFLQDKPNLITDTAIKLPTLIFLEDHRDAGAIELLLTLFPHLKNLGYHLFIDELPKNTNLELEIESCENSISVYLKLDALMKSQGLSMVIKEDIRRFAQDKLSESQLSELEDTPRRFIRAQKTLPFYNWLKENGIRYKAIDMENVLLLANIVGANALTPLRDRLFVDEYLSNRNAIGRHGHGHNKSIEQLRNEFLFVNVYTHDDCAFNNSEESELGVLKLNLSRLTIKEAERIVLTELNSRQAYLANHARTMDKEEVSAEKLSKMLIRSLRFFGNNHLGDFQNQNNDTPEKKKLNAWEKEVFEKYKNQNITKKSFAANHDVPFIQEHIVAMDALINKHNLLPHVALESVVGVHFSILKYFVPLYELGVRKYHLEKFKQFNVHFSEPHFNLVQHRILNEGQNADKAMSSVHGVLEFDARKLYQEISQNNSNQNSFK